MSVVQCRQKSQISQKHSPISGTRRGRDRMVVGFTTAYAISSNPDYARCIRYNIK